MVSSGGRIWRAQPPFLPEAPSASRPARSKSESQARAAVLLKASTDQLSSWSFCQVATTNPTWSHTVPPSTTFSTPPLALSTPAGARVTLVGVQTSEGASKSQAGKSIWCWRGEEVEKEVLEVSSTLLPTRRLLRHRLQRACGFF